MLTPDVTRLRAIREGRDVRCPDEKAPWGKWADWLARRQDAILDALLAPPADPAMTGEGCPQCGSTFGEAHQPTCRWRTPDGAAGEPLAVAMRAYRENPTPENRAVRDRARDDALAADAAVIDAATTRKPPAPGEAPGAEEPLFKHGEARTPAGKAFLDWLSSWSKPIDLASPAANMWAGFDAGWCLSARAALARPAAPVMEAEVMAAVRSLCSKAGKSIYTAFRNDRLLEVAVADALKAALAARGPVTEITEAMVTAEDVEAAYQAYVTGGAHGREKMRSALISFVRRLAARGPA